jgi:hypothetical protein
MPTNKENAMDKILKYLQGATENIELMSISDHTPKEYFKGYTQVISSIYKIVDSHNLL